MGIGSVVRVAAVVGVVMLLGACNRQPTVAPPLTNSLGEAEAALRAGDYVRADDHYRSLGDGATGPVREIALARRALISALPGTPLYDPPTARALLDQLLSEFPDTLMGTETQAVLGVVPEVDALRKVLSAARDEREQFGLFFEYVSPHAAGFDIQRARSEYRSLIASFPDGFFRQIAEHMLFLVSQWERLDALGATPETTLEELRLEVATLSEELEKLKEIDLGRRLPD